MKTLAKKILQGLPYLAVLFSFIINHSWDIKDHDDGHTLGYHAMGRNETIQRSYGAYDSMCDYLLGFLPVNFEILYGCMVAATLAASIVIIFLFKRILVELFNYPAEIVNIACALFIVGIPEYVYLSYSFKSTMISLAFTLASFYLLMKTAKDKPGNNTFQIALSIILFGFGASLRWAHLAYGLVIFSCYLFMVYQQQKQFFRSLMQTAVIGVLCLVSTLIFTFISGYPPKEFITVFLWAKGYMETTDFQVMAVIGDVTMYLTPLTLLVFALALFNLFKIKKPLLYILAGSSFLIYFILGFSSCFKTLSMLWLVILVLFCEGVSFIEGNKRANVFYSVLFVAFFVNWFIGVRIDTPSSNWGPGLEAKTNVKDMSVFDKNLGADNRFKLQNIKAGFFDGFSLPTAEGYRPLYGHFYALFCGKLKTLDAKLNSESDEILERAKAHKTIIYQDRINPYLLASYLRKNYTTTDPWYKHETFIKRTLVNKTDTVEELRIRNPQNLFKLDLFLNEAHHYDSIYLMFTFTSSCNKFLYQLSNQYNYSYQKTGPMSAVVWKQKEGQIK